MLALYRALLYLYPSTYRDEYGDEMTSVFRDVQAEMENKGTIARAVWCAREIGGLLLGAFQEHSRGVISWGHPTLSSRRSTMHSEFRFHRATAPLMAIILAGVVMAINKGKAISASIPYANPRVGPIQPAQFTVLPSLTLTLLCACLAGAIGWVILFALHRSGVQRFSDINSSNSDRSGTKLSI